MIIRYHCLTLCKIYEICQTIGDQTIVIKIKTKLYVDKLVHDKQKFREFVYNANFPFLCFNKYASSQVCEMYLIYTCTCLQVIPMI